MSSSGSRGMQLLERTSTLINEQGWRGLVKTGIGTVFLVALEVLTAAGVITGVDPSPVVAVVETVAEWVVGAR